MGGILPDAAAGGEGEASVEEEKKRLGHPRAAFSMYTCCLLLLIVTPEQVKVGCLR